MREAAKEKRLLYKRCEKNKEPKSREQYWAKKRKAKGAVAAAKEEDGKKIDEQLERNISQTLRYVFEMATQRKKRMLREFHASTKRWKAYGDTARENQDLE